MLSVGCPTCGKLLQIPEHFAGQRGRCNGCRSEILVPELATSPPELTQTAIDQCASAVATPTFAGFWWRALAYLIDGAALALPNTILSVFLITPLALYLLELIEEKILAQYQGVLSALTTGGLPALAALVLAYPYFALFECSRFQATPGKIVAGLRVTNKRGERISFLRAIWRNVAKLTSYLTMIGYLMIGFTKRKQGLHDFIAGTLVLRSEPSLRASGFFRAAVAMGCMLALVFGTAIGLVATGGEGAAQRTAETLSARTMAQQHRETFVNPQADYESTAPGSSTTEESHAPSGLSVIAGALGVGGAMPITLDNIQFVNQEAEKVTKAFEVESLYAGAQQLSEDEKQAFAAEAMIRMVTDGLKAPIEKLGYDFDQTVQQTLLTPGTGEGYELHMSAFLIFLTNVYPCKGLLLRNGVISQATYDAFENPIFVNIADERILGSMQGPWTN